MRKLLILVVLVTVSAIALKVYLGLTDAALGAELVQNPGFETAGTGGYQVYATGGNSVVNSGGKRIHTFTSDGTLVVVTAGTVDYLVVAGGGAGGAGSRGGGGGAGGMRTGTLALTTGNKTVTIGAGGTQPNAYTDTAAVDIHGNDGANSVLDSITATGGGGGGGGDNAVNGRAGGSGGGAWYTGSGGTRTASPVQGNNGGTAGTSGVYGGGGGGGAGGAGGNGDASVPGNGGAGSASSISGASVVYASGGSGANYNSATNGTTTNGAGDGNNTNPCHQAGTDAANNLGGGGGAGGNGGSGIVIVSYDYDPALTFDDEGAFASWWEGNYYDYYTPDPGEPAGSITDSATSHGGTHAARIATPDSVFGLAWTEVSQEIAVTPGKRYRFSFWHRGDGSVSARYALRDTANYHLITPLNQFGGGAISTGNISTTYEQFTMDFYAPPGCTTMSIQLGSPANVGAVYVDDVSLKEVPWSWLDKSADVLSDIGAHWNRGMQGTRLTDLLAGTGICTFTLDNSASQVAAVTRLQGQYSPAHANAVAGFAIGCPVKVTLNVDGAGETVEFIGRISNIRPSSGIYRNERVEVEAHDWMGYLSGQQLGIQTLAVNQRIDQGITTALAGFPIQPEATSFGVGKETFLTMFDTEDSQTSMASFFSKLARCEFGRIYLNGAGTLIVENRHVRPLNLTSAFTLDGTMSELDIAYQIGDIGNVIIVRTYPARIDTVAVRIWDLANAGCPKIEPGEVFTMVCPFRDPAGGGKISATSVVNPVTVVEFGSAPDYSSNDLAAWLTQTNEVGSNQMIVHLTNTSTKTGYLNDFQIYGLGIYHYSPIEMEVRDTFGIASGAGERREVFNLEQISDPHTGALYADLVGDIISRQHIEGVTVAFRANQDTVLAPLATAAEISQRFTLTEAQTGLSQDFFINKLEYEYRDNQLDVTILAVPASRSDCWIWDSSTWDNTDGEGWTL